MTKTCFKITGNSGQLNTHLIFIRLCFLALSNERKRTNELTTQKVNLIGKDNKQEEGKLDSEHFSSFMGWNRFHIAHAHAHTYIRPHLNLCLFHSFCFRPTQIYELLQRCYWNVCCVLSSWTYGIPELSIKISAYSPFLVVSPEFAIWNHYYDLSAEFLFQTNAVVHTRKWYILCRCDVVIEWPFILAAIIVQLNIKPMRARFLSYGLTCDDSSNGLAARYCCLSQNRRQKKIANIQKNNEFCGRRTKWDTFKVWDFIGQFTAAAALFVVAAVIVAVCRSNEVHAQMRCFLHYNDVENSLCTYAIFLYMYNLYSMTLSPSPSPSVYKIIYRWMCSGCLAKGIEVCVYVQQLSADI